MSSAQLPWCCSSDAPIGSVRVWSACLGSFLVGQYSEGTGTQYDPQVCNEAFFLLV